MAGLWFVTDHEILELDISGPLDVRDGADKVRYRVDIKKQQKYLGVFNIAVTLSAHGKPEFQERMIVSTILDLIRTALRRKDYSDDLDIGLNEVKNLLARRAESQEEQEFTIAKVLWRYFYDSDKLDVNHNLVALSAGYKAADVLRVFRYFHKKGYLKPSTLDGQFWQIGDNAMAAIEGLVAKGIIHHFLPIGYFQEVSLPPEFDKDYVFVLMPFSETVFPQGKFHNLIKPTLEESTKVNCWRADERQNQQLLTNQIYTQIVRARAIVAEISNLNPNVLIEIGVALAMHKSVYLFYDRNVLSKKDVPFYLDKIPFRDYGTDGEFVTRLKEVTLE